jgi:hypothetical protein
MIEDCKKKKKKKKKLEINKNLGGFTVDLKCGSGPVLLKNK